MARSLLSLEEEEEEGGAPLVTAAGDVTATDEAVTPSDAASAAGMEPNGATAVARADLAAEAWVASVSARV